jgi:hypothetical protein
LGRAKSERQRSASRQINRSRYSACLYLSSFIIAARGSPLHHVFIGRARKEAQVKLFIASYQQLVQHFDYAALYTHVMCRDAVLRKRKAHEFFRLFPKLCFWLFD